MGLSRASRIKLLLAIDTVFFFVELIVGYAIGSLALVADSFHMLNDVMSLLVALYAIKLTSDNAVDSRYSYGYHRAEILAALVNGVFLLALCFSIFMEAIERFFSVPEISNPRLIIIVGSLGLASNIIGLFLFHEHSHSHAHPSSPPAPEPEPLPATASAETSRPVPIHHKRSRSSSQGPSAAFSPLYGHPAATRAALVQAAEEMQAETDEQGGATPDENTPLLSQLSHEDSHHNDHGHDHGNGNGNGHGHGHGHSHGSMNMRGILLHVLGDALGNVGVIATGLVILLSTWEYKFYFDPTISLVITVIIFSSALPLVRSASFILLQAVPPHVSLDDVRSDILGVQGVISVHELHIWQLSETKTVASVHVLASREHDFMPVARQIRRILHHSGVHSSTIQPEYVGAGLDEANPKSLDTACLISCPPDQVCNEENACCPPPPPEV